MIPLIAAGIGALASMAGQQSANAASANQAGANMQWQEQISNTAHQREVADLRLAGLNPILSVNSGASTPGGAMAQQENVLGGMAATAKDAMLMKTTIDKADNENSLLKAQEKATLAQESSAKQSAIKTSKESALLDLAIPEAATKSNIWKKILDAEQTASNVGKNPDIKKHNLQYKPMNELLQGDKK